MSVTSTPCRLLIDGPAAGAWQMAVDEVLLETAAASGRASLRFYQWSEPTLSLGYFQNYADRDTHRASRGCAIVRRQTGGGAILHDLELTYSLALPLSIGLAADASWLYDAVHESLGSVLGRFGLRPEINPVADERGPSEQPFLCFQRRAKGDMLLDRAKICGSAQRRRRGAILQHGSVLLERSEAAPELPGIFEVSGQRIAPAKLLELWPAELALRLGLELERESLTGGELAAVRTLAIEKYDSHAWTRRR